MPHRPAGHRVHGLLSVWRPFPWEVTRGAGFHPLTDEKENTPIYNGREPARGRPERTVEPPRASPPRVSRGLGAAGGSARSRHPWHTRKSPAARGRAAEDGPGRGRAACGAAPSQGSGAARRRPRTRLTFVTRAPRLPPTCPVRRQAPHGGQPPRTGPSPGSPVRRARESCVPPCRAPDNMKDTGRLQSGDLIPAETCSPQRKQRLGLWVSQPEARMSARNGSPAHPRTTVPTQPFPAPASRMPGVLAINAGNIGRCERIAP